MRGTPHQVIHHLVVALIGDGGHHHGNGRHNRNVIAENSPTHNHGYQHTSNGNSGGTNSTQNALCRHVTVCNVTQKVIVVVQAPPAPPKQAAPAAVPVQPQPQPQVQILPQTIAEQHRLRPAPRPVAEQRRPVRLSGPFLYMGPNGFLLMGDDSSFIRFG